MDEKICYMYSVPKGATFGGDELIRITNWNNIESVKLFVIIVTCEMNLAVSLFSRIIIVRKSALADVGQDTATCAVPRHIISTRKNAQVCSAYDNKSTLLFVVLQM